MNKIDIINKTCKDTINNVNKIIISYLNNIDISDNKDILLDIYGLFQALFVGVDAIYELSTISNNSTYYINFKDNEQMRELKFIRNDIIGHPISRTYTNDSEGFSVFDFTNIFSKKNITYKTYVFNNNNTYTKTKNVDIINLIENYQIEVNKNIEHIININSNSCDINLINTINNIINEIYTNHSINTSLINNFISQYRNCFHLSDSFNDQLIKNLLLLSICIDLKKELTFDNNKKIIDYLLCLTYNKIVDICISIFELKNIKYFNLVEPIIYKLNSEEIILLQELVFSYEAKEVLLDKLNKTNILEFKELLNIYKKYENSIQNTYLLNIYFKKLILK